MSLLSPCLQEASASFAEWERLMKGMGSGVVATDNPFTQVMSLVTQMYKQTAIAKVMGDQGEYTFFYYTVDKAVAILNLYESYVPIWSIVVQKYI